MPEDVGDSDGTFHDRARRDSNVIINGKVRSEKSHRRSSVEASGQRSLSEGRSQSSSTESISQSEAEGKVVEVEIESRGGTLDTIAYYKNHQIHIEDGVPGETMRVRLESRPGYMVGKRVSARE